jgi:hypothetical protein
MTHRDRDLFTMMILSNLVVVQILIGLLAVVVISQKLLLVGVEVKAA